MWSEPLYLNRISLGELYDLISSFLSFDASRPTNDTPSPPPKRALLYDTPVNNCCLVANELLTSILVYVVA